jgi:4-diphosphocytidyl-2-C-methyl-D-erythritol kinase
MKSIVVDAFAKINLSLSVGGKRADGYHDVRTVLHTIALSDRLAFRLRKGPLTIACSTPGVPADRTNLIWRAANELWTRAGREGPPRDLGVELHKRIPMQAGLGGGSSDAAQTLLALRILWKLKITDNELAAIAARVGSDVPYFLLGGAALGLGRGEEIFPLADLPRWWVVLLFPPFGVATSDAYRWLDEDRSVTPSPKTPPRFLSGTWLESVPLANDFEPPVVRRHPVIGVLIERLQRLGAVLSARR